MVVGTTSPDGHPPSNAVITYIVRRLIGAILLLFIITAVTYAIFFWIPKLAGATTDDLAARFAGKSPTPDALHAIEKALGFDKPVWLQYLLYMKGVFAGSTFDTGTEIIKCSAPCFGYSYRNSIPVLDEITDRLPVTLSLIFGAAIIWLISGVAVGVISALRRGKLVDRASMAVALAGVSLPIFFTGLLGLTFLVHSWGVLPDVVYTPLDEDPVAWFQGLILPWIALAFLFSAMYARMTRAGMLDTLGEDYIRTARAKGLKESRVIGKHALRASLTPIVTIFGLDIGQLVGGAVITEKTFSLHGFGDLALNGIEKSDLPVVLGVVMFAALFIVIANLFVDIAYGILDPTVRTK